MRVVGTAGRARVQRFVRGAAAVVTALALASCGGGREASGNDVVVSGSGPEGTLAAGSTAVFTMRIENAGNDAAQDVRVADQLSAALTFTGITCEASGGAACPAAPALSMTIASLPAGGALTLRISAVVNGINAAATNTLTAQAAEDYGRTNNTATAAATLQASTTSLGVTVDASAATAAAGGSAVFRVTLANPSGGTAVNNAVLTLRLTAPFALDGITVACAASSGADCPATPASAATMQFAIPALAVARTLQFTVTVPVPSSGRGAVVADASVTATGDLDASNNAASASARAVDARSGAYQVYAADGRAYVLTIDFDARSYTMAGNGRSDTRSFDGDGVVGGGERLRSAEDIVVGSHAFAAGTLPYVAARRFVATANTLGGAFNLMSRTSAVDGSGAVTRVGTARISGNVLQLCQDDVEVVQAQTCSVGSLHSYLLTQAGDVFTATESATSRVLKFRFARSGAAEFILSVGAETGDDGAPLRFLIGTAESAGLIDSSVDGPAVGADGRADWVHVVLTRSTYSAEGANIEDVAGLFRPDAIDALPPVSMLQGAPQPTLQGAPIWVMQSYPLVVVVGATTSEVDQPNASGLLQIGVP